MAKQPLSAWGALQLANAPAPAPASPPPPAPSAGAPGNQNGLLDPFIADAIRASGGTVPGVTPGAPNQPPPIDWSQILGIYGLPPDVIAQINSIWATAGYDVNAATPLVMAYLRGTSWYAGQYPGIQAGINAGLFSDERGYVQYENQVNQLYLQYYHRAASGSEIASYLKSGQGISQIAAFFNSQAIQGTISDPLKAIFSADEIQAFADERAGIDSILGQKILSEANLFTSINTLYQNFYGRAPTRAELDTLLANGSDATSVAQQFSAQGFLNSVNPVLKNLFTPEELKQMALEAAGGNTQNGKQLQDMASLATQLNEVYQISYGTPVTRDELNSAYTQGFSASHVQAMLQSGVYAGGLPANVKALFTPDELKQAGMQASGASQTAEGERILNIVKNAGSYADLAGQYGQTLTSEQLKQYYDQGYSAQAYGSHLQGQAWAAASGNDIQQTSGAFGTGALSPDELSKLGDEKGGLDTPQGAALLASYNKALQRMNGVFAGVLARGGVSTGTTAPKQPGSQPSDVAA